VIQNVRPGWVAPDSAEIAARRPAVRSLRDGITLTPQQEAAMKVARERYRPRLKALVARWKEALAAGKKTTAIQDSVNAVTALQRAAVLALLTPTQRARYEANERTMGVLDARAH
jgi:hypothetical protein